MIAIRFLFPAILGYLMGSVNLSLIVTKYIGKFDITKRGSGNAGGTNVVRTMGFKWGALTILMEIAKYIIAGLFVQHVFPTYLLGTFGELETQIVGLYTMLFCMIGNVLPVFCNFKGGKGVSAIGAMILLFDWRIALICYAVFAIVLFASHTVSMGSLLASLTGAILTCLFYAPRPYWWIAAILVTVMVAIVWIRHLSNIKRLLTGTENKFNFGKKK